MIRYLMIEDFVIVSSGGNLLNILKIMNDKQ